MPRSFSVRDRRYEPSGRTVPGTSPPCHRDRRGGRHPWLPSAARRLRGSALQT